ncbi:unnamed protein product [Owenia fusiformis]|uniref:Uncharacterized protein n=1 Tax=Owenia fusiformis TaxID=6347 RepID=A0A8J1XIY9_OWEFU|nr:unnamed protein product [Owenia fusiformis]
MPTMSSDGDDSLYREDASENRPGSSFTNKENFNSNFRKRLNDLWHNDLFCDITLEVEGKQFNCHKVILSANSQYFQSMFSNGMSETSQKTIVMKDVSSKVMENILNHLYCDYSTINPTYEINEALDMFKAIDMLQIDNGMKDNLGKFLSEHINDTNCLDILNLTQYIKDESLMRLAYEHATKNFENVWESSGLLELDMNSFVRYLKDDVLNVTKEENVFHSIARWILHHPSERKRHAAELFECVRFCFIDPKVLCDEINKHEFTDEFPCLKDHVVAALRHQITPCYQHEEHYYKCSPRNCNIYPCILNPVNNQNISENEVSDTHAEPLNIRTVVLPHQSAARKQACLIGNTMYAFDGMKLYNCKLGEMKRNIWIECESRPNRHGNYTELKEYTLTLCGDFLYLIGGSDSSGVRSVIDFYNHEADTWQAPPDVAQALIHPVHYHRSLALESNIYIIGGLQPGPRIGSKFLQIYDTIQGKITLGPDAPHSLAAHSAVCFEKEIFVFSPKEMILNYNPAFKQWTLISTLGSTFYKPWPFVKGSKIMLLGGRNMNGNTPTLECTRTVSEYDTVSRTFKEYTLLTSAVCISSGVVVVKNKHLKWL